MSKDILAIEGISGAGKSTLIKALLSKGYDLVPELSKLFDFKKYFPEFVVDTESAIKSDEWFIEREIERCLLARQLKSKKVVADRWFYSILAHSYARAELYGTEDGPYLEERIKKLVQEDRLFEPRVIIIDVPLEEARKRLISRYGDESKLSELNMNLELLKKQKEFYINFAKERGILLLDGTSNLDQMLKLI